MTDLDNTRAMLKHARIMFEDNPAPLGDNHVIRVEAGYYGFYTVFTFSKEGDLVSVAAFE